MPGYVIHLAVGNVYSQNNKIQNITDFEKGIIAPDLIPDKIKSHYGQHSSESALNKYIEVNGNNLNSYQEGYFLHLATDYLFYNKFLTLWNPIIYKDYDILNSKIMKKYKVVIPEKIKNIVQFKDGNLSVLNENDIYNFIDSVGKIDIRQIIIKNENYTKSISTTFERKENKIK